MSSERRYSPQPFDPSLIRRFLRGREVLSAQLLPAGKRNTNYRLRLDDGGRYVLRIYAGGNAEREGSAMDLVRDLVPVPREIMRGENWSIFSYLGGELLEGVPECAGAAAEALARLSCISFDAPGLIHKDGSISAFPFGGVSGFFAEKLASAAVRAWIGPEGVDALRSILGREAGRLHELDAECRLVHGDFNPTNILIKRGMVSGILDWEFCHAGTPYMDIGNLLRNIPPGYHGRIKAGLEAGGLDLPQDWRERAELVDLTSQLEFLSSSRSGRIKRACVVRINRFIANRRMEV